MTLKFTKMHGLGNDFVVIDAINQRVELDTETIQKLSHRHFGVGFDQLLLVESPRSDDTDFHYRIFNADGGEVEQCGNGARCLARFVLEKKLTTKKDLCIETMGGQMHLYLQEDDNIMVDMGAPCFAPKKIPFLVQHQAATYTINLNDESLDANVISMGNPHLVLQVDNVDEAPIDNLGSALQVHPKLPRGVNVGFMEIVDKQHIKLRVYERGVGETLACGSGACAAVVAGQLRDLLDENVSVELRGGQLEVAWQGGESSVMMTGPAETVFEGTI